MDRPQTPAAFAAYLLEYEAFVSAQLDKEADYIAAMPLYHTLYMFCARWHLPLRWAWIIAYWEYKNS